MYRFQYLRLTCSLWLRGRRQWVACRTGNIRSNSDLILVQPRRWLLPRLAMGCCDPRGVMTFSMSKLQFLTFLLILISDSRPYAPVLCDRLFALCHISRGSALFALAWHLYKAACHFPGFHHLLDHPRTQRWLRRSAFPALNAPGTWRCLLLRSSPRPFIAPAKINTFYPGRILTLSTHELAAFTPFIRLLSSIWVWSSGDSDRQGVLCACLELRTMGINRLVLLAHTSGTLFGHDVVCRYALSRLRKVH